MYKRTYIQCNGIRRQHLLTAYIYPHIVQMIDAFLVSMIFAQ